MSGYLINFVVYTAAMVGLIFLALFVYKQTTQGFGMSSKSKFLNVEDSISLAPRKNLYIIRAGKERFLVASDVDRTSLISKLDDNATFKRQELKSSVDELPTIVDFPKNKETTVFQNIVKRI